MYWNSNLYLESKAPLFILLLHLLVLGSMSTKVKFLTEFSPLFPVYQQILPSTLLLLTLIFYCLTSFTNPGFLKPMRFQKNTNIPSQPADLMPSMDIQDQQFIPRTPSTLKKSTFNIQQNSEQVKYSIQLSDNTGQMDPADIGGMYHSSDQQNDYQCDQLPAQEDLYQSEPPPQIIVEARYCVVCNIEQPIRSKHCKRCNLCVAMHDHHCPWVGSCIGQKNRRYFWWYLLFQCSILWASFVLLVQNLGSENIGFQFFEVNAVIIVNMIVVGVFCIMTSTLLSFHSFLVISNLTTWQTASWKKISYLKNWPRKYGSPFSQGTLLNVYYYCCKRLPDGFSLWTVPSALPDKKKCKCFKI